MLLHCVQSRKVPDECKRAVKGEYRRRGQPAAHTQWSLRDQHAFMAWQQSVIKKGAEIGGFARRLPKATAEGPAPLPEEVQEFLNARKHRGKRAPAEVEERKAKSKS